MDGEPVNAVKGIDVPVFLFKKVGAKVFVMAVEEKVDGKFTGVGLVIDEEVGRGGREDGRCSRWAASVAGVGKSAGGIAHFVDTH